MKFNKKSRYLALGFLAVGLMALDGEPNYSGGVQIFGTSSFTETLTDGQPIDTRLANAATGSVVATDGNGMTYAAFVQSDGANNHIYLTRERSEKVAGDVNGATVIEIWDQNKNGVNNGGWSTNLSHGTPIDGTTSARVASAPAVAIDNANQVYVAYLQNNSDGNDHVMLSRYNVSMDAVQIWDGKTGGPADSGVWSTVLTDGVNANTDGIDIPTSAKVASGQPVIAMATNNEVYVAYQQVESATANVHIHLSRLVTADGAAAIQVWDEGNNKWSEIRTASDPIDATTSAQAASNPAIAIDSESKVYVTYLQEDTTGNIHQMLSRYNSTASTIQIWNDDGAAWSGTLTDARNNLDGIDLNTSDVDSSGTASMAVASDDSVYIAYQQENANAAAVIIRLSRLNAADDTVEIWDEGTGTFSDTLTDGDLVTPSVQTSASPKLVYNSHDKNLYLTYRSLDASGNSHVYLVRYVADSSTTDVQIWDGVNSAWTSTFTTAANDVNDYGIDVAATGQAAAGAPSMGADPVSGHVYVAYAQHDGTTPNHIFLSRFLPSTVSATAGSVEIWSATNSFTTDRTVAGGTPTPIDKSTTALVASAPSLTMAYNSRVPYVSYLQLDAAAGTNHIYLSRFGRHGFPLAARRSSDNTCLISRERSGRLRR